MTMPRARLALLAALTAGALAAIAPAGADASYPAYYNCVLKPVGQWCDGVSTGTYPGLHSWDYTEAWYPGSWDNTVIACEHVWKPSTGNELGGGGGCLYNWVGHYYGDVSCACYEAEVRQYSGGAHSINGFADADW